MSERLALMQLQNELRAGPDSAGPSWREGLVKLGFDSLMLENRVPPPGGSRSSEPFADALDELAQTPDPGHKPRSDEVAPIEKLDLLIRLSNSGPTRTPEENLFIVAVAKTLLDPQVRDNDAQLAMLLKAIDEVPKGRQVIRMPALDGGVRLAEIKGPRAPWLARRGSQTVGDVLDLRTAAPKLKLVDGLAGQPVVVVEACIYKARVGQDAEYPVHLRTTISYGNGSPKVADFEHLLDPGRWPEYNSFWSDMKEVEAAPKPVQLGDDQAPTPATPEEAAIIRADAYITHVDTIEWHSVGTFHEQVGFESGPNGGVPVANANNAGKADKRDLYPETFLYFSRAPSTKAREVLTYTLLRRLAALRVDDGCIEVKQVDKGVDIITTKSLYVSGAGSSTELAGILAYMAAYSGWGANTLMLVSNAAKK